MILMRQEEPPMDSETASCRGEVDRMMCDVRHRNPHEPEFHQAVETFLESIMPCYLAEPSYQACSILERLLEPDRLISFRVSWQADDGTVRCDRAWRVQFNNALGPYKGGLRFHESVTQDTLKFLGFEQTLKNGLTNLPMGGAKGGSTFSPKHKSDAEIMRFCQSLMAELQHYIGTDMDVPAGDIGVHDREIGFLFGHYIRLQNRWSGVLTSKGCAFGGSAVRHEATGYGCVYFCEQMLNRHSSGLRDQRIAISGSGTVALNAAVKATERGARVVTLSDSDGTLYKKDGLSPTELESIVTLKQDADRRLAEIGERSKAIEYFANGKPWAAPCEIAMPCATQNELDDADARQLIENGVRAVCEGANMPVTEEGIALFREANVLFAPGKAANAGGVAISGLEQSQNAMRVSWTADRVNQRLKTIMSDIHAQCLEYGNNPDATHVDYVRGANIAGFKRVAEAMKAYGVV
jgi:glutamate dehydrogenase (NADP+)